MKNPWRELSSVNPQRDNGHRQINNLNFHALMAARLSGAEYQVVLTVLDQTWGYKKTEAHISLSQFMKATLLSKVSVITAIDHLEGKRLVLVDRRGPGRINWYVFNKYSDTWLTSKANDTTELVKQTILEGKANDTSGSKANDTKTSKVPTPSTETTKEIRKHLNKAAKESDAAAVIIKTFSEHYTTTPEIENRLAELAQEFLTGWVDDAIKQAADNGVGKPLPYITKVLKAWVVEGHPTTRENVSAAPVKSKKSSPGPVDPEDSLDLSKYREQLKARMGGDGQ